jgi:ubiquinone/menaquinone biosynthesis C-methylase UbiE
MPQEESSAGWQVDRAKDPQAFVKYLDKASARGPVQAIKRQSYELMQVRAGHRVLDVGCGVGDDVRALAQFVGASGAVIGADTSEVMIAEARRRSEDESLPVEFLQADCHTLPFPDASFDACRAERLLQHVADPEAALRELVRVARPRGRIVVIDADHGMMALNFADRHLARRVLDTRCDALRNGWIGRQLPGLLRRQGLLDIEIHPTVTYYASAGQQDDPEQVARKSIIAGDLRRSAAEAERCGVISAEESRTFLAELETLEQAGEFFLAGVMFVVAATKSQ